MPKSQIPKTLSFFGKVKVFEICHVGIGVGDSSMGLQFGHFGQKKNKYITYHIQATKSPRSPSVMLDGDLHPDHPKHQFGDFGGNQMWTTYYQAHPFSRNSKNHTMCTPTCMNAKSEVWGYDLCILLVILLSTPGTRNTAFIMLLSLFIKAWNNGLTWRESSHINCKTLIMNRDRFQSKTSK